MRMTETQHDDDDENEIENSRMTPPLMMMMMNYPRLAGRPSWRISGTNWGCRSRKHGWLANVFPTGSTTTIGFGRAEDTTSSHTLSLFLSLYV